MNKKSVILIKGEDIIKFDLMKEAAKFLMCDLTQVSRARRYGWRIHGWRVV